MKPAGPVVAVASYCAFALLAVDVSELTAAELLIPLSVLAAYALSTLGFPAPWRYLLALGPWLLVASWVGSLYPDGLDCGDCDDGTWQTAVLLLVSAGFAGVILAGPVLALARLRARRRGPGRDGTTLR